MTTDARAAAIGSVLESVVLIHRRLAASRATPFGDIRLTRTQVDVLFLLAHRREPVTPGSLAATLGVTPGAVTQLVDGLRDLGLVDQTTHPGDARSRVLELSAPAAAHVAGFEANVVARMTPLFEALSDDEATTAADLLARVG